MVIRSWSSGPLKHSKSSRTITTGGRSRRRPDGKLSSSTLYPVDNSDELFAGVFSPILSLDLVSWSGVDSLSITPCDLFGLPCFVGDSICSATGDAGNFWSGSFLTGNFAGELEYVLGNSWCCNTTTVSLRGVLAGETDNLGDLDFPSATLGFGFSGEFGSVSSKELTPVGERVFFGVVGTGRNFCGVEPLRRPARDPAGDAGYFCGDSHADVIMFWRLAGVPPGVFDDVLFCGDAGMLVPHLSSLEQSLLECSSGDGSVYKNTNRLRYKDDGNGFFNGLYYAMQTHNEIPIKHQPIKT